MKALDRLEGRLADLMEPYRADLVRWSLEADYRREDDPGESPRHFINLEMYESAMLQDPIWNLQRLLDRLGARRIRSYGIAPWAAEQSFTRLVESLRQGNREEIFLHAGDLAHYLADLHQPLHTTRNFDGQESNQLGIHSRFEGRLLDLFIESIPVVEGSPVDLGPVLTSLHGMSQESFHLVPRVLAEDRRVVSELPRSFRDSLAERRLSPREFPDRYYSLMFSGLESFLSERLNLASRRLASLWWMAWEQAGKPNF